MPRRRGRPPGLIRQSPGGASNARTGPSMQATEVQTAADVGEAVGVVAGHLTDLPAYSGDGDGTISLLHMLDELDQTQGLLEEEFPECKIGYAHRPGHATWSAQIGPVLNADSPEALRAG